VGFRIAHVGAGEWSRCAHSLPRARLAEHSIVSLELICDLQVERAAAPSVPIKSLRGRTNEKGIPRMELPDVGNARLRISRS
jgi:hypothetical protein